MRDFISGIALGLRHQTPEDIEEPFQQTGTLHLFAVAGLHVGIVAGLLWMLAMVARLSRKWAAAIIIPSLFFYAAVTGLHVSSVRAAVMSSILFGGFFFERKVFVLTSPRRGSLLSSLEYERTLFDAFNSPSRWWVQLFCVPILSLGFCNAGVRPILSCHGACYVGQSV